MVALLLSEVPSSFRRIISGIRGNSAAAAAEYRIARSGSMGNEHMVQQQTGNAQHFRFVVSTRELPDMMSAKFLDFLNPSPFVRMWN